MNLSTFERIKSKQSYVAVVGLGYVGLPIAVAFAEKVRTLGFDINEARITSYKQGRDLTHEVGDQELCQTALEFTTEPAQLKKASFIIVAVPTPVNEDTTPDLRPVLRATKSIGQNLSPGTIVVYESTVYPGVTEDLCLPVLERESGLVCGRDFKIGYSPERINPGDKVHRLANIRKIVAGIDRDTVENIAAVYELIIAAGVYEASSIRVAEAAKLVENVQRDVNVALMNEMAMAFEKMGLATKEVLAAMNTKWNALGFFPGLVGGHCVGVDPYYFIHQARQLKHDLPLISRSREINEHMAGYVADMIVKKMRQADQDIKKANVYVLGMSFKEDCPDMRNSKSFDVCRQLAAYGIKAKVVDPVIEETVFKREFSEELVTLRDVKDADCLVFLVGHKQFKELSVNDLNRMFSARASGKHVLVDIKGIFDPEMFAEGYCYWSL